MHNPAKNNVIVSGTTKKAVQQIIIPFFRPFFKDEKCRQKHAEFISEFCVFLFALSIGRFRWILENILMRICRTRLPFLCALYIFFFAFARAGFRHLVAYIDKKFNRVVCGGGKHNRNPMQLIHVVCRINAVLLAK